MLKSHSNAINNKNNIINNKNSNNSDYQTAIPKLCASINKTNKPDKLKFGNRKKLKFISWS